MSLRAHDILAVRGDVRRPVLQHMDLDLRPGRVHALIGPNGAGKTTALRLLAGDHAPDAGRIELDCRDLRQWSPTTLARRRAVFTQHDTLRFPFTAEEVVALGRLPWGTAPAPATIRQALEMLDAGDLAQRPYTSLSGGERARVRLARALVQIRQPPDAPPGYLLLDEPLAHLDFVFRHRCLARLRDEAALGSGVLLVMHDPELALRYADDATLLGKDGVVAQGPVDITLTATTLSTAYGADVAGGAGQPLIVDTSPGGGSTCDTHDRYTM